MLNNPVIDVSIGLVFIFLLYSLLATILQEIIAAKFSFRAKVLEKAILRMLEDGSFNGRFAFTDRIKGYLSMFFRINNLKGKPTATAFYAHPLIKYLAEDNWYSKPAYIQSKNFSKVMVDILRGICDVANPNDAAQIEQALLSGLLQTDVMNATVADTNHPATKALQQNGAARGINPETLLYLRSLWMEAGKDVMAFRMQLEDWFDTTMQRVTGWYKRYTQMVLFLIGMGIAVCFNVDSISIAQKMLKDPVLRGHMVQSANDYLSANSYQQTEQQLQDTATVLQAQQSTLAEIDNATGIMGLGYTCHHPRLLHVFCLYPDVTALNFAGWFITALAISLGAPFWFDMLNKLTNLRSSKANTIKTITEAL